MKRATVAFVTLTLVAAGLAATLVSRSGTAAVRLPVPWATLAVSRSLLVGEGIYLVGNGDRRLIAPGGFQPSWSADGRRLSYVAPGTGGFGDVFVADANGAHAAQITYTDDVEENSPSWSPNGRHLAFERAGQIVVVRADGSKERSLVRGEEPAWSPGGQRIAFQQAGDLFLVKAAGGRPRPLVTSLDWETEPSWSPNGRHLAYVSDQTGPRDIRVVDLKTGASSTLTADEFVDTAPAFTANGRRILFVSNRAGVEALWSVPATGGPATPAGGPTFPEHPAARPRPALLEVLPDLDQQPPSDLDVRPSRRGYRLWFTSAADNVGLGPLILNGRRRSGRSAMRANQRVRLTNQSLRTYPEIGSWRYNASPDHSHWHLLHFQRYELRRVDGSVLVRDRKSGFCIGDRYGVAPGRIEGRIASPVFRGYCNTYQPRALQVDGGTSVGYSDRYHSRLDGQNLDISRVATGEYVLVNRANPQLLIAELRYENNAASLRIRIAWPRGRSRAPTVRILRTCPDSDRC